MKLKNLIPMLNVSDIKASLNFYQTALAFEVVSDKAAIEGWRWACIRSGDTELMLSESEGRPRLALVEDPNNYIDWPCIYYFYPDDVVALYQHIIAAGLKASELKTTFYGMKEFTMQDPDGHMLSFGQATQ